MDTAKSLGTTTRTVRFHEYGEPTVVLRMDEIPVPAPPPGRILVNVVACGVNPADWALCRGLFAGTLPRGIGLELSGTVLAVGEAVTDVGLGDLVFGTADYAGCTSAGASDLAVMDHWTRVPAGLDPVQAAALPMAAETAFRSLDGLGARQSHSVLVHGAGTTVGFAAVQIARRGGARVFATAGPTFSEQLRACGAEVTAYGDGMVERVRELVGGAPDLILDTSPPNGVLPDLVRIADGDASRVFTITDFPAADALGVRHSFSEGVSGLRYDLLPTFAEWAVNGQLTVPIAKTFALDDWQTAVDVSLGGKARGKLLLLPAA